MQKTHLVGARTHNLRSRLRRSRRGRARLPDGRVGLGQIEPRARHALRRGAAALRRELQPVRAAVPRAARAAADGRARAGRRDGRGRSARAGEELALDGRDDGRSRAVPRRALRARGGAGLSGLRRRRGPNRSARRRRRLQPTSLERRARRSSRTRSASAGTEDFLELREPLATRRLPAALARGEARDLDEVRPSEAMAGSGIVEVVVDRVKSCQGRTSAASKKRSSRRGSAATARRRSSPSKGARSVRAGLVCPKCARTFEPPRAGLFSYHSPLGACPACRGFGRTIGVDWDKVIPDHALSIEKGAHPGVDREVERRGSAGCSGSSRSARASRSTCRGASSLAPSSKRSSSTARERGRAANIPGVRAWFKWLETRTYKMHVRVFLSRYRVVRSVRRLAAARASTTPRSATASAVARSRGVARARARRGARTARRARCANRARRARRGASSSSRLAYLERVGLGYLTLDRQARTLSGGEAQRVSLTTALGSSLTGALFVLDEPTVGLHPTDVPPLVDAMRELAAARQHRARHRARSARRARRAIA